MKSSFTATTPGGAPIAWDAEQGFSGPLAQMLNAELSITPGQTHTPPAVLARQVLLFMLPGCTIADFVSVPLPALGEGVLS